MLWLKLLLGYCVLVGIGMWFGYRSHKSWPGGPMGQPSHDADEPPGVGNT